MSHRGFQHIRQGAVGRVRAGHEDDLQDGLPQQHLLAADRQPSLGPPCADQCAGAGVVDHVEQDATWPEGVVVPDGFGDRVGGVAGNRADDDVRVPQGVCRCVDRLLLVCDGVALADDVRQLPVLARVARRHSDAFVRLPVLQHDRACGDGRGCGVAVADDGGGGCALPTVRLPEGLELMVEGEHDAHDVGVVEADRRQRARCGGAVRGGTGGDARFGGPVENRGIGDLRRCAHILDGVP